MTKFYITHTDSHNERHQLEGAWDAETADDAIRQMLDEAGVDDDGRWEAFKVEDQLYIVARSDGENREYNLTADEAAHRILTDDGGEYELRPRPDGEGFDLWARQQVAGIGWRRTHWFSLEPDPATAEADIFARVIEDSSAANWRGLVAEDQDGYARSEILRMKTDLEDSDRPIEALVAEWSNAAVVEIDDTGNIWIEKPQAGHWLNARAKGEFLAWCAGL